MGLGDDMMLAGEAREMRRRDPRKVAARHKKSGQRWSEVFVNNPNMATMADVAGGLDVQWLDENAGRRYRESETPERRIWTNIGPARPDLYLTQAEKDWAARLGIEHMILVEPSIKPNATVNKNWGHARWQELIDASPSLPWLQIGMGTQLRGVRRLTTPSFRHAAAVIARVRAAVLPEGGLHHAAAALGTRAVVLFGGYISPVQTGYPEHVNIFTGGEPCGMRVPCDHCKSALAAITPARVLNALDLILSDERKAA